MARYSALLLKTGPEPSWTFDFSGACQVVYGVSSYRLAHQHGDRVRDLGVVLREDDVGRGKEVAKVGIGLTLDVRETGNKCLGCSHGDTALCGCSNGRRGTGDERRSDSEELHGDVDC